MFKKFECILVFMLNVIFLFYRIFSKYYINIYTFKCRNIYYYICNGIREIMMD